MSEGGDAPIAVFCRTVRNELIEAVAAANPAHGGGADHGQPGGDAVD